MAYPLAYRCVFKILKFGPDSVHRSIQSLLHFRFPLPVTILYSLKYFNETLRQAALSLVQDVQDAFIDMLRSATWMANSTRTRAIEKAKNVVVHIGYPNGINEIDELKEYYKNLKLESYNFINNSIRWNVFNQNQMFKTLRKPENRSGLESMLDSQPNEANAYYTRSTNTIRMCL